MCHQPPKTGCCFSHSCESNEYLVPSQFSQVAHLSNLCIWFAEHIWLACTLPRNRSFWIISWRNKAPMQDMRMLKSEQVSTSEALHDMEPLLSNFIAGPPFTHFYDAAMRDFFHFLKCPHLSWFMPSCTHYDDG